SLVLTGGTALSTADIDAGTGLLAVTLSVSHGIVSVGGDTSGLTALFNDGTATVNLLGTLTALNNALSTLTYAPTANYSGADTLTFFTDDQGNTGAGGPKSVTSSLGITVNV